ncbi:hypothetical protein, partial [Burkholderia gladioli]|uniref:hypothetical protein n=1 Tax=Burkholderia gladioli TaxID=28095 RepID=UPI003F7931A7
MHHCEHKKTPRRIRVTGPKITAQTVPTSLQPMPGRRREPHYRRTRSLTGCAATQARESID